jgi:hypothetical protein
MNTIDLADLIATAAGGWWTNISKVNVSDIAFMTAHEAQCR